MPSPDSLPVRLLRVVSPWSEAGANCTRIWDLENASFERECIPYVTAGPSLAASFIFILFCLRPLLQKRRQLLWISNFATEEIHHKPRVASDHEPEDEPRPAKSWTRSRVTMALLVLSVMGLLMRVAVAIFYLPGLVAVIPWIVSLLIISVDRPVVASNYLIFIYIICFFGQLGLAISNGIYLSRTRPGEIFQFAETCITFCASVIAFTMPFRDPQLESYDIAHPLKEPTSHQRSPEDNLSPWQFMTVSWMSPLISLGGKKQLLDEHVWMLPYQFQHSRLHELFRALQGSVTTRLLMANGLDLFITSFLGIIESLANFSVPILLQQLLRAIQTRSGTNRPAIIYAGLILAVRLVAAQSAVFSLWYSRRCYERSRGEMITMLYEKTLSRKAFGFQERTKTESAANGETHSLDGNGNSVMKQWSKKLTWTHKLSAKIQRILNPKRLEGDITPKSGSETNSEDESTEPASMGKILNLMRNDVYEIAQRFWEFPNIITKPLGFIFAVILVWKLLGWPCLLGMFTVIFAQMINSVIIRILLRWERVRRTATDVRLQVTSQFVEAIRHLRWYDWQEQWLVQIMEARRRELSLRFSTGLFRVGYSFVNALAGGMFPAAAFYAYTRISGQRLTVDIAFPALQLFNMLSKSLRELPGLIQVLLNARVAMSRIEDFMAEPDKSEATPEVTPEQRQPEFIDASFAWPGATDAVLTNVSVRFPTGLTVVCGKVGEGKTALLQAILGELDQRGGVAKYAAEIVGYCGQTPWLQSMSIRDNILFFSPFDERRYKQVLDACALIPDLVTFKHGDLSNLGENGIGLSGGQRSRVALARAIYSRARVLVLDDPLAALDHDTAESIVMKLFCGPLTADRIVILATHRVDLCFHVATQIVEVAEGTIQLLNPGDYSNSGEGGRFLRGGHDSVSLEIRQEEELAAVPDAFIEEEKMATGSVMMSVYWRYIKSGRRAWWVVMILIFALMRLLRLANFWFLKEWGERYDEVGIQSLSDLLKKLPSPERNLQPWLIGFALLALVQSLVALFSELVLLIIVYIAGKRLFKQVMRSVCGATFRFYDVTPVGRLMNRLTSDMGTLDGKISEQLLDVAYYSISWIFAISVIASVTPLFLVFSCLLSAWFVLIFLRFLPTSQSLRRLEMVSLTPLMSNFGALLSGLTTVRAFRAQKHFQDRVITVVDNFQKMDHFYWSLQAWLVYRFDLLSACSTFALTLLTIWNDMTPGMIAFVLTAASNFVSATHSICKQYGQLQMDFVSVERVIELLDIDQEPVGQVEPPASWPAYGDDIEFDNVTIKYAPHLDPALYNVSFRIPGRSTTAIIGRTGSGKSTLALTLLATILPEEGGHITIGDMDTSKVNVHTLRQRVTFVAQDPVLFNGSIRKNLDPSDDHSDEECAAVLKRVLGEEWDLYKELDSGGRNLSQGQRQLIGLGRAMLRRSPVVILDEATASIDLATAQYIQSVLRDELKECTIITIAHRIDAVKDADYCIVLDHGRVAAQGPAQEVLDMQAQDSQSTKSSGTNTTSTTTTT